MRKVILSILFFFIIMISVFAGPNDPSRFGNLTTDTAWIGGSQGIGNFSGWLKSVGYNALGDILPLTDDTYDIGNSTHRFQNLYAHYIHANVSLNTSILNVDNLSASDTVSTLNLEATNLESNLDGAGFTITAAFIGDLTGNADSATLWSSVSSFQPKWFADVADVFTFDEVELNATIIALSTNSTGTVTNVATGAGLTGGPITTTGTIATDAVTAGATE